MLKNTFAHSPFISKYEETRKFFEVYPHPSMVVLFNLDRILRYKAKPHRDYAFRYAEFLEYQNHLKELKSASPGLALPKEITERKLDMKAQALKSFEDTLDGIFCAYIAYYCWANPEKCAVLGSMEGGYILTPIFDKMKAMLGTEVNQKKLL